VSALEVEPIDVKADLERCAAVVHAEYRRGLGAHVTVWADPLMEECRRARMVIRKNFARAHAAVAAWQARPMPDGWR
jgi:hypothetical protein